MSDELFETFKACAAKELSVDAEKVVPEAKFSEDLGADSLDIVEFVMALEEAFEITIDSAELEGVETVGQAFDLVKSKKGA